MTEQGASGDTIPGLLTRPPREAVRLIAMVHTDAAEQAFGRLTGDRDDEALHDFRVALRRLRSVLRAYGPLFEDSVRSRLLARLRRLARATGRSRDLEVRARSLAELAVELPAAEAAVVDDLIEGVRRSRARVDERMLARVERRFPRLLRRLQRAFRSYTAEVPHAGLETPTFANAAGVQLDLHSAALLARLTDLDETDDVRDVHVARIEAKRLRYLIEPFLDHAEHAGENVRRLKKLQDVTGDLHDAEILLNWLDAREEEVRDRAEVGSSADAVDPPVESDDAAVVATEEPSPRPEGSVAASAEPAVASDERPAASDERPAASDEHPVGSDERPVGSDEQSKGSDGQHGAADESPVESTLRTRTVALLQDAVRGRRERLWSEVRASVPDFEAAANVAPLVGALLGGLRLERERKYLLSGLPPEAHAAPSVSMEQGYLPGEELVERLRLVDDGGTISRWRTVKIGTGLSRIEVEEPCDADLFDALWPFTEGRRVSKRRFTVYSANESGAWEVDSFTDRELVLAEFELTGSGDQVEIPEWLSRYLVREVTGEREYVNAVLAK